MTWRTVKQLADAAMPEELFTGQWQNRPSVLDGYKPYLDDRWNEGWTNAWKLWEEIVPLGCKGSYQRVRAYLHEKRTSPRPVTAPPPSPRAVAGESAAVAAQGTTAESSTSTAQSRTLTIKKFSTARWLPSSVEIVSPQVSINAMDSARLAWLCHHSCGRQRSRN
ncbi:hypothetical protein OG530_01275 [Streptomyces decoyicus]|uniref:hypothetical protein n=1 Tax=Streptomyces decoyicus TaxID=249567 RepID=UPI002E18B708